MHFVCPCPSPRRRAAKALFVPRDTPSRESIPPSFDETEAAIEARAIGHAAFRRHRIASFSFEHDPVDMRGPRGEQSWMRLNKVKNIETITNRSAYDQDAPQLSVDLADRPGTSGSELRKALEAGKLLSDRVHGNSGIESAASSLKRRNAVRDKNHRAQQDDYFHHPQSALHDADSDCNDHLSSVTYRRKNAVVVGVSDKEMTNLQVGLHQDRENNTPVYSEDEVISRSPYKGNGSWLRGRTLVNESNTALIPGSNLKILALPEMQNIAEFQDLYRSISEIIIPPSSPKSRASSHSNETSQLSRRPSSNHQYRSTSFQYSGDWKPTSLPTYNVCKAPQVDQYVGIPKRKSIKKVPRASRFREEFDAPVTNVHAFYDGTNDDATIEANIDPGAQSQPVSEARHRTRDSVSPTHSKGASGVELGIWSTSFSMFREELKRPNTPATDHSGWGTKRRSSLRPLEYSTIPMHRVRGSLNPARMATAQEYDDRFHQMPRAESLARTDTSLNYAHYSNHLRPLTETTFDQIQEDDEGGEEDDEGSDIELKP